MRQRPLGPACFIALLLGLGAACGKRSEALDLAAPDFALTDQNPSSPTFELERRLSEARGKVVVLYFARFS